jgi:HlyD family secretion protein
MNSFKYLKIFLDDRSLTLNIISLQLLFIACSIFELVGISLIGPLFYVLSIGAEALNNNYLNYFYEYFSFTDFGDFALYFSFLTMFIILLGGLFSMLSVVLLTRVATYGGVYLGNKLFSHYLRKDWVFYLENKKSMMINEIYQETSRVTQNVLVPVLMMNKAIYLTLLILILLMAVDWKLTIGFFLGLAAIYLLIYFLFKKNLNKNSKDLTDSHEDRFRFLDDTFSSIKEIHIWMNSKIFLDGFDQASRKWSKALRNNMNITNLPRFIVETFILILICLTCLIIFSTSTNITSSLPSYSIFLFSSLKLLPAIQQIYYAGSIISGNSYSIVNLHNVLNTEVTRLPSTSEFKSEISSLVLRDINFTHKTSNFSLKDLNLTLETGSILGITGLSGSGKSTLVDIMMGLLKLDNGSILVNDLDSDIYESSNWFKKIAYLPQKITLTNNLLGENIHFQQRPDINFDRLNIASRQSNLDEFAGRIDSDNFKSLKINNLSGGQIQRVGIARTLYKDADVIFFDEPTSALDNTNKNFFIKQIQEIKKDKIIIIVSHDVELLEQVDNIAVLNNGSLEFLGTFNQSIQQSETMQELTSKDD